VHQCPGEQDPATHAARQLLRTATRLIAQVEYVHQLSRAELWEYIRALHADGTTVLLRTHYLEEAEELCEEVVLLRAGRVIARASADQLREDFGAADIGEVYAQAMAADVAL
jgi:ABC-type Na+ transport system ATPase subunit NatA